MRFVNFIANRFGLRRQQDDADSGLVTLDSSDLFSTTSLSGQKTFSLQLSFNFRDSNYGLGVTRTYNDATGRFESPSFFFNRNQRDEVEQRVEDSVDQTPLEEPASDEPSTEETYPDYDSAEIVELPQEPISHDTVISLFGHDVIDTGNGNDLILSGFGRDTIFSGTGDDTVLSGYHNDVIIDADGHNALDGGSSHDTIIAGSGDDTIDGGSGNDSIHAGYGNNAIDAGSGHDTIAAYSGNDSILAGTGDDLIHTGRGDDTVFGGTGADHFVISGGNNHLYGGAHTTPTDDGSGDLYSLNNAGPGTTTIYDFVRGQDQLNIEGLSGGSMEAVGGDFLLSFDGMVEVLLKGISELDLTDFVPFDGLEDVFTPPEPEINVVELDGTLDNHFNGTEYRDSITAGDGDDTIFSLGGDDTVLAGNGSNSVDGGDGNDLLYSEFGNDILYGGAGDDFIEAGYGNDTMHGGDGNDTLVSEFGNNLIYGDGGDDQIYARIGVDGLYGGTGNDTIFSGASNDQVYGGAGNDVFDFSNTHAYALNNMSLGFDTIHDFSRGEDKLNIEGLTGGTMTAYGNDLLLSFDQNTDIYILNVTELDIDDFVMFDGLTDVMTF